MAPSALEPFKKSAHTQKRKSSSERNNRSDSEPLTGRAAKRAKTKDAREIESQPSGAGLSKGGELDLQAFLNAREFEIKALEGGMRKAKASRASRAHQQVPREMRRRTASHNVKRIPKKLRHRAAREQKDDATPHVEARTRRPRTTNARIRAETAKKLATLAKRKKGRKLKDAEEKKAKEAAAAEAGVTPMDVDKRNKEKTLVEPRPARPKTKPNQLSEKHVESSRYKKRQKDHHWLPTHIWHAKRAHIEKMWNFKIPTAPNNKSYRATHRAVHEKGAVCWDTSYYGTIRVYGKRSDIDRLLAMPRETGLEALAGSRRIHIMYSSTNYPDLSFNGSGDVVFYPPDPAGDDSDPRREFFIRVHPLIFCRVWHSWREQIRTHALDVKLEDLRWEIGSLEISGPAATETLLGVLKPYLTKSGQTPVHYRVLQTLGPSTAPSIVPASAILSFDIKDPRLEYPPRTYRDENAEVDPTGAEMARLRMLADWPPDEVTHRSGLFDRDARFRASCLPSQKHINRRRGNRAPGTPVPVTSADPPIPIMLFATRGNIHGGFQGTWTLLAPWNCIMPLWHGFMHYPLAIGGNPRFGCLEQVKQIKFEQGLPFFPRDFPGSEFGLLEEMRDRLAAHMKAIQLPAPRGDKPYRTLDLGAGRKGEDCNPYGCDWESLFGWNLLEAVHCSVDERDWEGEDPPPDAVIEKLEVPFHSEKGLVWPDWVSNHPLFSSIRTLHSIPVGIMLDQETPAAISHFPNAITTVRITMIGRGVPTSQARIYRLPRRIPAADSQQDAEIPSTDPTVQPKKGVLPNDLRDQWLALLPQSNKKKQAHVKMAAKKGKKVHPQQPRRMPPNASIEERKSLLAASILSSKLPYPRPEHNTDHDMDGHPLVPNKGDLMGFVTTGGRNLSLGKGMGIGHVKVSMIAEEAWALGKGKRNSMEGRLCVVRNKGESVGWLARWDLVDTRVI